MAQISLALKLLQQESEVLMRELIAARCDEVLRIVVAEPCGTFQAVTELQRSTVVRLCPKHEATDLYANHELPVVGVPQFLPFQQESFEGVIVQHTLEHVHNPQQVLAEISRILKPEGYVFITGYNAWGLVGLYRSALNLAPRHKATDNSTLLAPPKLQRALPKLGLHVKSCSYVTVSSALTPNVLKPSLKIIEQLGSPLLNSSSAGYVMVAQKKVHGMTPIPLRRISSKRRIVLSAGSSLAREEG